MLWILELHGQGRNSNWSSGCRMNFSEGEATWTAWPEGVSAGILTMSTPEGQIYITAGPNADGQNAGIRDAQFQLIENHPSPDVSFQNIRYRNALLMPVPGYPDRVFLFYHKQFETTVRKYGWLEVGPDGTDGQLRMTDEGPLWFMLNPAIKCTAIAHDNGEDYWFITQASGTNEVHAFRIGDQGVEDGPVISSGGVTLTDQNLNGFFVTSPQGDQFVNQITYNTNPSAVSFELYDFDASTGEASLTHTFLGLSGETWGAEFSPSGQFLYLLRGEILGGNSHRHTIYQYDLSQQNIEASRMIVDQHDWNIGGSQGPVNNLSLGPDGRIYGNRYPELEVSCIQFPDEISPNCGFIESIDACSDYAFQVPNPLKYYHDDTPLDITVVEMQTLGIWPNPITEVAIVSGVGDGPIQLRWYDMPGRIVQEVTLLAQDGRVTLNVQSLPSGAYTLQVTHKNGMSASVRVCLLH